MTKLNALAILIAGSLLGVCGGFAANASPDPVSGTLISQTRSPEDIQRQREAEERLKDTERRRERDETIIIIDSPYYSPYYPYPNYSRPSYGRSIGKSFGIFSFSAGFKDGTLNPAIGYRFSKSNIGFEIGAVFSQDKLPPGTVNNYAAGSLIQQFPTGFTNLGVKTTTANIGGDVLGFFDVSPSVSVYGGVGVYLQGKSQIFQSNVTTDLFKETNETNVNLAVSGGADFKLGDAWQIGVGYHSLRGVNAKIGYEF
jgi:opacity protein-like surface antigen